MWKNHLQVFVEYYLTQLCIVSMSFWTFVWCYAAYLPGWRRQKDDDVSWIYEALLTNRNYSIFPLLKIMDVLFIRVIWLLPIWYYPITTLPAEWIRDFVLFTRKIAKLLLYLFLRASEKTRNVELTTQSICFADKYRTLRHFNPEVNGDLERRLQNFS